MKASHVHFWTREDAREGIASPTGLATLRRLEAEGMYTVTVLVECPGCPDCRGVRGMLFLTPQKQEER